MSAPLHVAVLMGGWSAEREVSLSSGKGIAEALASLGHRVTSIDMGHDVAARLAEAKPDIVFNALHGTPGEDGSVQGMLDLMGLKYTHSGLATSVIAIDKQLTKLLLVPAGIPMPGGRIVQERDAIRGLIRYPGRTSSSRSTKARRSASRSSPMRAITAIRSRADRLRVRGPEFEELLAEPYIRGRELTTAVLGETALGVTELRPKSGWYDYDAKYTDGMTEHVFPAAIPDEITAACKRIALDAHRLLGCKGASRSDFRWDDEQGVDGSVPAGGQHAARHDPAQPRARTSQALRHFLPATRPDHHR